MKVAVYHNQPPGGARRALHGFCIELARRHELHVFTLATADDTMLHDGDFSTTLTRLPFAPRRPARFGLYLNDLRRRQTLDDLDRTGARAAALIDARGFDVALVDCCRFSFTPSVLRFLRTPAVYYCHHGPWRSEGISERAARSHYEAARHLVHAPFERSYERLLHSREQELVLKATAVAVNSQHTRARLASATGRVATVCPPGVLLPSGRRRTRGRYVLAVGDLVPHKGHDLVVAAVGALPAGLRPPVHVVGTAAGRTYRIALERLAERLGVSLDIRLGISQAELEAEFDGAAVFAFGSRAEPLGLAPLEAMAHGLPVVAVAEGGLLESVSQGRTGFLVRPEPGLMAEQIGRLLREPELAAELGRAGRALVEDQWSWPARAAALERVLVEVASRQPVGAIAG